MSIKRKSETNAQYKKDLLIVKEEMKKIWKITTTDFMGFELLPEFTLSYHHIKKYEKDGIISINNGALLVKETAHALICTIEFYDKKTFAEIQKILKIINHQRTLPTIEQLIWINQLLDPFERKYEGETSSRNTPLIKPEFSKRLRPTTIFYSY